MKTPTVIIGALLLALAGTWLADAPLGPLDGHRRREQLTPEPSDFLRGSG